MKNNQINLLAPVLLSCLCILFNTKVVGAELKLGPLSSGNAPVLHKLELSPGQLGQLANVKIKGPKLSSKETKQLRRVAYDIFGGRQEQGKNKWEQLMESIGSKKSLNSEEVMNVLFRVFQESISDMNEDKKYWIAKLKMHNEIGDALSEHIKELNEQAIVYEKEQELAELKGDKKKEIVVKVITCIPTRFSNNFKLKTSY